ncbi:endolytic transglycosylase MltG [Nonomuraea rhodomycinica]|uniref:Endolytic murein transglycosylase n=1 Tax=Nonomuraea rhodomycinica TaxID=1712872 RepID=A0A7Y6MBW7_9ACTN|nr:endolytic transglycosylase MltG [Nonomuraea rhodomycinica]NUW41300.1 endolytic transglycosylase MltG [Nonomuraea rhodomycinica]
MNIEDVLRDTLADMAHEEPPPPPERFLRAAAVPGPRGGKRRGMALAAAAAVAVLAAGTAVAVRGLSGESPGPAVATGPMTHPEGEITASSERDGKAVVTVQEGFRLADTLRRLARASGRPPAEFERAAKDGAALGLPDYANGSLEGFAFPGTYEVAPGRSAEQILADMVTAHRSTADQLGLVEGARRLGRDPRDIMIVASIVQAEASSWQDMPKIARTIYNRLGHRPPMKLEMDSPLMYALGKYAVAASDADLKSRSRYNTYRYHGLPPGPIGNPGRHAIEAALRPAPGSWLYYVTVDPRTGATKFARSPAEYESLLDEQKRRTRAGS